MRRLAPDLEFDFFKRVQIAFYHDNMDTNDTHTYLSISADLDVDPVDFERKFNSKDARNDTLNDFERSRAYGVRSFPSLVLRHQERLAVASPGYMEADRLIARIHRLIA